MDIKSLVHDRKAYLIHHRRWFHEFPELSYQEFNTQDKIISVLSEYPELTITKYARTGVVADLNKGQGKCLAIRADMDALPLHEQTGLPYASKNEGVMHACGHDTHMAVLLTLIDVIHTLSPKIWVRFIFQPSEENNFNDPEGLSGAARMIKEGALAPVDSIIGFHQRPQKPAFHCSIMDGEVMASSDSFKIEVEGKSAHAGAAPHEGIDAILIAAEIIQFIQKIPSRWTAPEQPVVVSISTIQGGKLANIVADHVQMTGTIRTRNMRVRQKVLDQIQNIINGVSSVYHCKIYFKLEQSLPVTSNDPSLSQNLRAAAQKILPKEHICQQWGMMASEDFAFYGEKVPSCFIFFGTQPNGDEAFGLHHPKMRVNEDALLIPVLIAAQWIDDQSYENQ